MSRNKNDRRRSKRNEKQRQAKQRQESLRREQAKKRDEPNLRLVSDPPGGSDSPPPPSRMSMERTMRVRLICAPRQESSREEVTFRARFASVWR